MTDHFDESNPAVRNWRRLERSIAADIGETTPLVRIPDEEPCPLEFGLHWAREMVLEGWYVAHLFEAEASPPVIWLKQWEYGEPEPTWERVRSAAP
jgi:hypothetical protein